MSNDLKAQGRKAFIWDFLGKIAMQGVGFIISIFLARLLEPSDFGMIAMAMVILGIVGIFLNIGFTGALVQRKDYDIYLRHYTEGTDETVMFFVPQKTYK